MVARLRNQKAAICRQGPFGLIRDGHEQTGDKRQESGLHLDARKVWLGLRDVQNSNVGLHCRVTYSAGKLF